MAIYSSVPPPAQQAQPGVNVAAWNEAALQSVVVGPTAQETGVPLSIALDALVLTPRNDALDPRARPAYKPRKEPLKRDSMKRREALLKGKEGSRRRQRWENGQ